MSVNSLSDIKLSNSQSVSADLQSRSLLRFITCGSVDDGKSTLIGRILYETGSVLEDQLMSLESDSKRFGTTGEGVDYALLVDGLVAEREQGITIDVAYRYFSTPQRAFIVADTPGHEQYTRNMATGASNADVAILLVDARKGLLPQTRRHSFIVSLMGVKHVIVAINKMDLVGFKEDIFRELEDQYISVVKDLGFKTISLIPVSARNGDNLTTKSSNTPWYKGAPLLQYLENIEIAKNFSDENFAFPIQLVNRPDADFRGYSGTIASGRLSVGDEIVALPSLRKTVVKSIISPQGELENAKAGEAVTITLQDEIDLTRGDVIIAQKDYDLSFYNSPDKSKIPYISSNITAKLIVTGNKLVTEGAEFIIKIGVASTNATIKKLHHIIDVETYLSKDGTILPMNGIGLVSLKLDRPLVIRDFAEGWELGGFILIDRISNETTAFGFVDAKSEVKEKEQTSFLQKQIDLYCGSVGTEQRIKLLSYISWRFCSAAIIFGIIRILGGNFYIALLALIADLILRPILYVIHKKLWHKFLSLKKIESENLNDGGGI